MRATRRQVLAGLAALSAARPALGADWPELRAAPAEVQLAPEGYPATSVWAFGGQVPGPVLRVPAGGRLRQRVVNGLDVPTSVHWHGIRLENAMDGVAGLTQEAIAPGATFDYDFSAPDAGTYWYHSHNRSFEQVARGLLGPLIVEEAQPPEVDLDEILMLDDWRLNEEAEIAGEFGALFDAAHGGRIGNWVTVNGQAEWTRPLPQGARVRLRLVNAANARIFSLRLSGFSAFVVALDGQPLPEPFAANEITLAPAQRADLIADVTADEGDEAALITRERNGDFIIGGFPIEAGRAPGPRPIAALPPNPAPRLAELPDVPVRELLMEGGAMGGMRGAMMGGAMMEPRALAERGMVWAFNGMAGMPDAPFAEVPRGTPVRIALVNDTSWPHGMHLHGQHFHEVEDGRPGAYRDTTLIGPQERREIAFIADNPGDWLLHCHMLAHAASGMMTWIRVT